ncbi:hypothetical protein AX16_010655 [Volvariella volvacea WC 439]|nr:hypothetical protein AX16_010655 [Volvariella volvacea WC 439]
MHVPVERIERVITSHWHSDHTGGLLSLLTYLKGRLESGTTQHTHIVADVHPDRPIARGIATGPKFDKIICAIPRDPTFAEMEELNAIVEKHAEGHAVADRTVWVSGEIPRVTEFEGGLLTGVRWVSNEELDLKPESRDGDSVLSSFQNGAWVKEPHIMDERYTAVDVSGKGLIIFSACSHAGIVNVIKDAVKAFSRPIYMVIGGLHLAGPEVSPRIPKTVNFLAHELKPAPAYILPMHCSGFQSKLALEEALGDGCVPAGVGHRIEITGDREHDARLFPATF